MPYAVYAALLHRHLVLGADRELAMLSILLTATLAYAIARPVAILLLLILQGGVMLFLREVARRDPFFMPIMRRTWRLQGYVSPRGAPIDPL